MSVPGHEARLCISIEKYFFQRDEGKRAGIKLRLGRGWMGISFGGFDLQPELSASAIFNDMPGGIINIIYPPASGLGE